MQTSFSKPDPSLDQNIPFPKRTFMPSLYLFQIWPILKFGEIHSKDQLQWHSLVFYLSLLFIWSKKNNNVDTLWSFGKAQSLGLGYVPSTTTRKPPLSNSDFFSAYWRRIFNMLFNSDSQRLPRLVYIDDPSSRVWFEPRVELQRKLFSTAPKINLVKLLKTTWKYYSFISV